LKKIPVSFVCDSGYVMPTVVAITSLLYNKHPDTYYDIYIINADLSEPELAKFHEFRSRTSDVHVIKAYLEKCKDLPLCSYVPATAYLNFDLPNLISNQDKVLHLDSDVIIQRDLSELFAVNIDDYYAGVVKDIGLIDNDFNIKNYFNNGVMLLNLKLMRENDVSSALLNIAKSGIKLKYMDQDCFNILFEKKVKLLPIKYNCFNEFSQRIKNKYAHDYINKCFETNYSSLDNLTKDSCIIHFAGSDKPWIYYDCASASRWDKYFKKSSFNFNKLKRRSVKLRRLKENILSYRLINLSYLFFKCWRDNGFNLAMGKVKIFLQ
jgi:lipopolysaccharide biosynthesis glycosyltransferase